MNIFNNLNQYLPPKVPATPPTEIKEEKKESKLKGNLMTGLGCLCAIAVPALGIGFCYLIGAIFKDEVALGKACGWIFVVGIVVFALLAIYTAVSESGHGGKFKKVCITVLIFALICGAISLYSNITGYDSDETEIVNDSNRPDKY